MSEEGIKRNPQDLEYLILGPDPHFAIYQGVMPPLTQRVCPVINEASSLAK